jgi:superfamily II DNA or RNA helicase
MAKGTSNLWSQIDPKEINSVLSSEYLEILEPLLERPSDDIPLKDDRAEKAQIYKMSVLSQLSSKAFRRQLFSHISKDELRSICKDLEIPFSSEGRAREDLVSIAWEPTQKARKLAAFLGVPSFILDVSSTESTRIPNKATPWVSKYEHFLSPLRANNLENEFAKRRPFKTLKTYQASALQDVLAYLRVNFGKCILNMPTGTGKTRTAMEVVCYYLVDHPTHSVVWIAPSRELLDQATLEFAQLWEFVGDRQIQINRRDTPNKTLIGAHSQFVVTSFQTLLNDVRGYKEAPIGLIVIDEAHQALAKKWSKAFLAINRPDIATRTLGLTATPVRENVANTKGLAMAFNNNLVQLPPPKGQTIVEYLIEQGILARPIYQKVSGGTASISKTAQEKIARDYAEFPKEVIERLARDGGRNLAIVNKLKEVLGAPADERQVLFFAITVQHSRMITTWLLKSGYPAFHLDATVNPAARKNCIDAFRTKKLRVLCNYGVLSTGFDAPQVGCVFIARPTTSHVLHSQMVGRGLRGPEIGGTPSCLIIEVEDNIENFAEDQRLSFERYLELWSAMPSES